MLYRWNVHPGEKGGPLVGKTKSGKGTKLMVLADGAGTPLGIHVEKASPSEMTLVEATLNNVKVKTGKRKKGKPERLIGDRGYDSNKVRAFLVKRGIEPIIPARGNNTVATHQDGRKMRRYKRRWKIERSNSWLQNFRRLTVRYERSEKVFTALVHMACALITLKRVLG
jgi:transposase